MKLWDLIWGKITLYYIFPGIFFFTQISKFLISFTFPKVMFSPSLTESYSPHTPPEDCHLGAFRGDYRELGTCRGRVRCSSQSHQASSVLSQAWCEQRISLQLLCLPLQCQVSEPLKLSVQVSGQNSVWLGGAGYLPVKAGALYSETRERKGMYVLMV